MSDIAISDAPATVRLADYSPPAWTCTEVDLLFDLHEDHALVTATSAWSRTGGAADLVLDGSELQTESILMDGDELPVEGLHMAPKQLTLARR